MVDLYGQYARIKPEVDAALQNVIDTAAFINGPDVKSFAQELSDHLAVSHLVTCANGTDALQLAFQALNLPTGSEVLVASFNYVAAAEVIAFMGLKPVFVDSEPDTFNLSISDLENKITENTRAIIAVHLFGQTCDMDSIMESAGRHNLYVIEDNAQSIGSKYTDKTGKTSFAGTIGHIGTTSFFPSKNLSCMGDGGAVCTNDSDLAEKMRMIAGHGQKTKYFYDKIGVNSRLDTLQAAVLRIKLRKLDSYIAARQKAAEFYDNSLSEKVQTPARFSQSSHVFHQYTLQFENRRIRDKVKTELAGKGIPSMIYYPKALHLQNAYLEFGHGEGSLPDAETLSSKVLSLPMHTELSEEQLNTITTSLISVL